jgi:phosphonate transport system ATP-binding protein
MEMAMNPAPCGPCEAITICTLTKTFTTGQQAHRALDNVSLSILPGQMVGLIGASGSGKSTLLRNVAGLTAADSGPNSISVLGRTVQAGGAVDRDIRAVRARVGFIFQQFNIVGHLTVLTNVLAGSLGRVPAWRGTAGWFTQAERLQALEALARVGMEECAPQRASTLSGGQQQRVAIARALMQGAEIILADEPIASLDPVSARNVMEILWRINREDGKTVVVSLHQVDYALRYCERIVALRHGEIVYDGACADVSVEMLHEIYGDKFIETCVEEHPAANKRNTRVPALASGSGVLARAGAATY